MITCNNGGGQPVQDQSTANEAVSDANVTALTSQIAAIGATGLEVRKVCVVFVEVVVDTATGEELDPSRISEYIKA